MKRFGLLASILIFAGSICSAQRIYPTVLAKRSVKYKKIDQTYDIPVKIIFKPRPKYPDGQVCVQGNVTLRVEFLFTGEIGNITAVSRLGYGMTENAIEAAKQMKFEPAQLRGKPVTIHKTVQFGFTIY